MLILEVNPEGRKQARAMTYKESVLGHTNKDATIDGIDSSDESANEDKDESEDILEKKHGIYDCLETFITPGEESRICRPWRKGWIVKLLG